MAMLRAIRMLNNLQSGALSGAALQTSLADTGRLGDLVSLLQHRGYCRQLAASSTAMTAVAASSTAMTAVAASSTAMTAVAASSTAVNAILGSATAKVSVANSSVAMAAIAASSTAMNIIVADTAAMNLMLSYSASRQAIYDSATAWTAISGSATAKAALSAAAAEHTTTSTAHVYPAGSGSAIRVVFVQQKSNAGSYSSYAGANADTYITASTTYVDRYAKVTGLTHRTGNAAVTSYVRYVIME